MSPSQSFDASLEQIEAWNVDLRAFLTEARLAKAQNFTSEIAHCEAAMSKVQMRARQIMQAALDCQIECMVAMKGSDTE